jgi:prevent-host-death family protein
MGAVGAFEAKPHFPVLLELVERGEEVVITRHGKVIARLVPAGKNDQERVNAAITKLKELRAGSSLDHLSWKELRDVRRR